MPTDHELKRRNADSDYVQRLAARVAELEAALRDLTEILPDYMGLAVYLSDEERTQFYIAESGVIEALEAAQHALKGDEAK